VAIVSVMAANNETGLEHRWEEVARMCREAGVWFHCDAAQWVGKRPAGALGRCDIVTVSAHKFGGPKGTGLLVIPDGGGEFASQVGGPQEGTRRAGTEDVAGIAAMLAAWRERDGGAGARARPEEDRDWFEAEVTGSIEGVLVIGRGAPRRWNTSMLVMPEFGNLKWLTRLSRRGFAVSTGSACSSGKGNPSHVMAAMGLDHDEMGRVLRISSGPDTERGDWEGLAGALEEVWKELARGGKPAGRIDLGRPGERSTTR
jgi:cysteine desulfurase